MTHALFTAIPNRVARSDRWIAASDIAFAAWTKLCIRASESDNGGRFGGARTWTEAMWLPMANVTSGGVEAAVAAGLCQWKGDALVVMGFDQQANKTANATVIKPTPTGIKPANKTEDKTRNKTEDKTSTKSSAMGLVGGGGVVRSPSEGGVSSSVSGSDPNPIASENPDRAPARGPGRPETVSYPEAFNLIWKATGQRGNKHPAFKAWVKFKPGADEVIKSWSRWMETDAWRRGFIPYLSTWLNRRGWEDEPPPEDFRPRTPPNGNGAAGRAQQTHENLGSWLAEKGEQR